MEETPLRGGKGSGPARGTRPQNELLAYDANNRPTSYTTGGAATVSGKVVLPPVAFTYFGTALHPRQDNSTSPVHAGFQSRGLLDLLLYSFRHGPQEATMNDWLSCRLYFWP